MTDKVPLLTEKERAAFAALNSMLTNARGLSASEWISVNGTGSQRLADYRYNLEQLQKSFFESVVARFPNYSEFEFVQHCTDIVAIPNGPVEQSIHRISSISTKSVRNALRALRRENGSECVFSIETILAKTFGRKSDLERILNNMSKAGEVFRLGDAYRLN